MCEHILRDFIFANHIPILPGKSQGNTNVLWEYRDDIRLWYIGAYFVKHACVQNIGKIVDRLKSKWQPDFIFALLKSCSDAKFRYYILTFNSDPFFSLSYQKLVIYRGENHYEFIKFTSLCISFNPLLLMLEIQVFITIHKCWKNVLSLSKICWQNLTRDIFVR